MFITILDSDLESLEPLDCDFGFDFDAKDADEAEDRDVAGRFIELIFGFATATSHVIGRLVVGCLVVQVRGLKGFEDSNVIVVEQQLVLVLIGHWKYTNKVYPGMSLCHCAGSCLSLRYY